MEMCLGVNLDMISDLPANVTDQIIVRLPITDAVRTSVLSTKWRYKWTTIPELVFHDGLGLPYKDKLIHFIDRVLLLHSGFIHKFQLSNHSSISISSDIIDVWISFLSRKNIKELVLKFPAFRDSKPYKLPTCFFSAQQQISSLELEWCVLKPPPTFTGFSNLKSLNLQKTTFVDKGGFECFISRCPLLERLTWESSYDLGHLSLCSPNLKYLCLSGHFEDIYFKNAPLLSDVSIDLLEQFSDEKLIKETNESLQSETGNVIKFLSSLPNLRKFVVEGVFLRFLAMGKIPEKLPFTCHHLNILSLHLNFEDVNEICVTLCLLNSSPNLQQLVIDLCDQHLKSIPNGKSGNDIENFWEERTLIDWNMSGLQIVKITDIYRFELDLDLELEFIRLLLAHSPMLEMLSIICCNLDMQERNEFQFLKELVVFPRASPKAKIRFLDELEE